MMFFEMQALRALPGRDQLGFGEVGFACGQQRIVAMIETIWAPSASNPIYLGPSREFVIFGIALYRVSVILHYNTN